MPSGQRWKPRYKKLVKQYRWKALTALIVVLFFVFMFFVPLQSKKGINPDEDVLVYTCIAYTTKDHLPPGVDIYKKFHILKGQYGDYQKYKKRIAPKGCYGGLETVKAELYL